MTLSNPLLLYQCLKLSYICFLMSDVRQLTVDGHCIEKMCSYREENMCLLTG